MSSKRLTAAIASISLIAAVACADTARALDAYWWGYQSNLWGDGIDPVHPQLSNWFSAPRGDPNAVSRSVPDGTARFGPGADRTAVRIGEHATIGRMSFTPDAPRYSFVIPSDRRLILNGAGVVNQSSAVTPWFQILGYAQMRLRGEARFGSQVGARGALITTTELGKLTFEDMTRGGDAEVLNRNGGATTFTDLASAERMTITNSTGGFTVFRGGSTGDRAHIINQPSGILYCNITSADKKLPIGKVDNHGRVELATTKLLVGRIYEQSASGILELNVSSPTNFGAVIAKGGARLGGNLFVRLTASAVPGFVKIVQVTDGPVAGRFAKVSFGGDGTDTLRPSLVYTARDVRVVLQPK
jgi:hypothetical protein